VMEKNYLHIWIQL